MAGSSLLHFLIPVLDQKSNDYSFLIHNDCIECEVESCSTTMHSFLPCLLSILLLDTPSIAAQRPESRSGHRMKKKGLNLFFQLPRSPTLPPGVKSTDCPGAMTLGIMERGDSPRSGHRMNGYESRVSVAFDV